VEVHMDVVRLSLIAIHEVGCKNGPLADGNSSQSWVELTRIELRPLRQPLTEHERWGHSTIDAGEVHVGGRIRSCQTWSSTHTPLHRVVHECAKATTDHRVASFWSISKSYSRHEVGLVSVPQVVREG